MLRHKPGHSTSEPAWDWNVSDSGVRPARHYSAFIATMLSTAPQNISPYTQIPSASIELRVVALRKQATATTMQRIGFMAGEEVGGVSERYS